VRQDSTTATLVIVCDTTTKLGWAARAVDIVTVNLECMASALRGKNLDTRKTAKDRGKNPISTETSQCRN